MQTQLFANWDLLPNKEFNYTAAKKKQSYTYKRNLKLLYPQIQIKIITNYTNKHINSYKKIYTFFFLCLSYHNNKYKRFNRRAIIQLNIVE